MEKESEMERLPIDLLAHILLMITSFTDLAQASGVCRKWKQAVKQALATRQTLSFAGCKMDDDSTARLVRHAYSLKELDISRSRWGCQITDNGLYQISLAKCVTNLTSISLWGMTGITDKGVVQLITRTNSLKHLNVGGTFVTDESLSAIADNCPHLKSIVLWSCRHVTESGLFVLAGKACRYLAVSAQLNALVVKIIEVTADGHYFFRALADQLEGAKEQHGKYRGMVVQYNIWW